MGAQKVLKDQAPRPIDPRCLLGFSLFLLSSSCGGRYLEGAAGRLVGERGGSGLLLLVALPVPLFLISPSPDPSRPWPQFKAPASKALALLATLPLPAAEAKKVTAFLAMPGPLMHPDTMSEPFGFCRSLPGSILGSIMSFVAEESCLRWQSHRSKLLLPANYGPYAPGLTA